VADPKLDLRGEVTFQNLRGRFVTLVGGWFTERRVGMLEVELVAAFSEPDTRAARRPLRRGRTRNIAGIQRLTTEGSFCQAPKALPEPFAAGSAASPLHSRQAIFRARRLSR
jgi:hypothetical protein